MLSHFDSTLLPCINIDILYLFFSYFLSLSLTLNICTNDRKSHKLRINEKGDQELFYIRSSDLPSRVTNEHFLLDT